MHAHSAIAGRDNIGQKKMPLAKWGKKVGMDGLNAMFIKKLYSRQIYTRAPHQICYGIVVDSQNLSFSMVIMGDTKS